MRIEIPYVVSDVDRHGNVRLYYRRKGKPKVRVDLAVIPRDDKASAPIVLKPSRQRRRYRRFFRVHKGAENLERG